MKKILIPCKLIIGHKNTYLHIPTKILKYYATKILSPSLNIKNIYISRKVEKKNKTYCS